MGILDLLLGKTNPVSQYVDTQPYLAPALGAGLASGTSLGGGFANAAQNVLQAKPANMAYGLQQQQLQLAIQGRNATADWIEQQKNPNLSGLAEAVRNGTISGSDALTMMLKPGEVVAGGSTVLPNVLAPGYAPSAGGDAAANSNPATPGQPAVPAAGPAPVPAQIQTPQDASNFYQGMTSLAGPIPPVATAPPPQVASLGNAGAPQQPPSSAPAYTPSAPIAPDVKGALTQALAGAQRPVPLAPIQPTTSAPQVAQGGAPASWYDPSKPSIAPGGNPVNWTPQQRVDAAAKFGMKPGDPGYANWVLTAKLPNNVTETWSTMSPDEMKAAGINPGAGAVIQKSTLGQIRAVNGVTSAGVDGEAAIGTTGSSAIDPTIPGYATKPVVAGETQATIDQKALSYLTSGTLPPVGRTGAAGAQAAAISNRMAELAPDGNLAANRAQLKALSGSLAEQTKYLNNTQRAFNTATDTLANLQSYMEKNGINTSQYPDYNKFVNFIKAKGLDPGAAGGYNAQLQTLRQEYSQVLAKGGVRSVETDREAAQLIPDGLAPAQLAQVAAQIKIDSDNAIREAQNQVSQVSGQINGIIGGNAAAPTTQAPAPAQTYTYNPKTGKLE